MRVQGNPVLIFFHRIKQLQITFFYPYAWDRLASIDKKVTLTFSWFDLVSAVDYYCKRCGKHFLNGRIPNVASFTSETKTLPILIEERNIIIIESSTAGTTRRHASGDLARPVHAIALVDEGRMHCGWIGSDNSTKH
ncbi:hypothetical protein GF325_17830 [Candidatus Bathyarchaeota archaeon]|nr:hypothetical protein [Candidatus Bathyarchaeota archaeon]